MNRRGFLGLLAAAATLDPERLLWRPGAKVISVPPRVHVPKWQIISWKRHGPPRNRANLVVAGLAMDFLEGELARRGRGRTPEFGRLALPVGVEEAGDIRISSTLPLVRFTRSFDVIVRHHFVRFDVLVKI